MRIVQASFQIEDRDELRGGLHIIERAGRLCYKRTGAVAQDAGSGSAAPQLAQGQAGRACHAWQGRDCYKSDGKVTGDSAEAFVKSLIRRKHLSVLEHGDMIFEIGDRHIYENVAEGLQILRDSGKQPPMLEMSNIDQRYIVSGNIRAWMELFGCGSLAGRYFIGHFDPVFIQGMDFLDEDAEPDPRVRQIHYADLRSASEKRTHLRHTVRFTVDRGVSHEFVRHRKMSFSQESTRYCNYANERFGREITVISPCYLLESTEGYALWKRQCMSAENAYFTLLNLGLLPQEARAVLPTSTKTELMMTGNLRAWQHFFDLRAKRLTGAAHNAPKPAQSAVSGSAVLGTGGSAPAGRASEGEGATAIPQAEEVAIPLYELFRALYPETIA